MADSYTSELREIIDRTFVGDFGGRATAQMVHNSVYRDLPDHLIDHLIGKGIRAQIGAYFREQGAGGLPKRPEVNADGEHAQLAMLTVAECSYVHDGYLLRAEANRAQAEKVREFCIAQHGVDLAAKVAAS